LNKQVLDFTTINSPMSGNVIQKFVSIGKVLQIGTPIAVITDVSQFRLIVNIAPQDLHLLGQGMVVEVAVPSQDLEGIKGVVKSISVQATEAGSFPVEIIVANNQPKLLRAGMQAEVRFATDEHRKALLIPRVAVAGDQVFVVVDGKAIAKKVSIAKEYGTEVEITSGLSEGDLLVIKGQNNLENNQLVQVSSSNQ
jgi:membrane fusion protein, multidrug efflux system